MEVWSHVKEVHCMEPSYRFKDIMMENTSAGSLNTVKSVLCFHYEKFPLHHIQSPIYIPFEIKGEKQNNPLFHCRLG